MRRADHRRTPRPSARSRLHSDPSVLHIRSYTIIDALHKCADCRNDRPDGAVTVALSVIGDVNVVFERRNADRKCSNCYDCCWSGGHARIDAMPIRIDLIDRILRGMRVPVRADAGLVPDNVPISR
ncbi:MAG: hypothetical protein AAGB04_03185 [Pseudomonadota bacterium]